MIEYDKNSKLIEEGLTEKEAKEMQWMRTNIIRKSYESLLHKSQRIRDRYDELFNSWRL